MRETHEGVLRARRSISLYNFSHRFAHSREGGSFVLLRAELLLSLICLFIYNNLPTLDFPLHLCTLC